MGTINSVTLAEDSGGGENESISHHLIHGLDPWGHKPTPHLTNGNWGEVIWYRSVGLDSALKDMS